MRVVTMRPQRDASPTNGGARMRFKREGMRCLRVDARALTWSSPRVHRARVHSAVPAQAACSPAMPHLGARPGGGPPTRTEESPMTATVHRAASLALHPLHAVLLASTLPLLLGAVLSDIAYAKTYHVQWTNFASWLVLGGVVFAGIVLVFALVGLLRSHRRDARSIAYVGLVLAVFVLGFFNSLVHAKDA
jgi:hypothetical protein